MFCTNCGKENPDGAAFCVDCGASLAGAAGSMAAQPAAEPVAPSPAPAAAAPSAAPQPQPQTPPQPASQSQPRQSSDSVSFGQHFKNLFSALLKPVTGPIEISKQYEKTVNAIFLAGIVVVICGFVGFVTSLSVDLVNWGKYGKLYSSSIAGTVLKDIFFPFIYYSVRTFGFAGLMLLAGLIVKEKFSFAKILAISAMAVGPAYVVRDLIGTYFDFIPYIGSIVSIGAYIYYVVMIYEGVGAETKLTGNKKAFVIVAVLALTGLFAGIFAF